MRRTCWHSYSRSESALVVVGKTLCSAYVNACKRFRSIRANRNKSDSRVRSALGLTAAGAQSSETARNWCHKRLIASTDSQHTMVSVQGRCAGRPRWPIFFVSGSRALTSLGLGGCAGCGLRGCIWCAKLHSKNSPESCVKTAAVINRVRHLLRKNAINCPRQTTKRVCVGGWFRAVNTCLCRRSRFLRCSSVAAVRFVSSFASLVCLV